MKLLLCILLFPVCLFAQSNPVGPARFDNTWLNGWCELCVDTMFGGSTMTFDTYPPRVVRENRTVDFYLTNTSFSDQQGKLLVYANGNCIADVNNDTLINGDSINPDYSLYQDALSQGAVLLPQPGNDSIVFLIHEQRSLSITATNFSKVFLCYYSIVNLYSNTVLLKNKLLVQDTLCYGKITAAKHANGRDWWIIVPKSFNPSWNRYFSSADTWEQYFFGRRTGSYFTGWQQIR